MKEYLSKLTIIVSIVICIFFFYGCIVEEISASNENISAEQE